MGIERDDLNRLEDRLTEAMALGFAGVNGRLDTLNGRTRKNESAIAVLEDRSAEERREDRREGRKHGAAWGGFAGGFAFVGLWILEKVWK